jgi:PPIC-type PPIASE domain
MGYLPLVCMLLATFAWGQQQPAPSIAPPGSNPPIQRDSDDEPGLPASASKVDPDTVVITISGICPQAPSPSTASPSNVPCQTQITRAQFEGLADAILKNMKPARKLQLAKSYPNLLAMAREAEARGLERTPRFEERLAFARLQILSQELVRQIEEDSARVPEKDIDDYYRKHAADFETTTLERIFIPNQKLVSPLPKEKAAPENLLEQRHESEEAMKQLAEKLRARAAAGEDFRKLQKEAYAEAGATDIPPNPNLGQLRVASLPPAHASVFELKSGEISQVISDGTGHYIYKVDSKNLERLETVSDEIRKTIAHHREEEAIQAVQRPIKSELNPAYFGPLEKTDTVHPK